MRVDLEVTEGPGKGRTFSFDRPEVFLVGRSLRCHFCVGPDEQASRIHMLLEVSPSVCRLRDLGSTNHTFVNDQQVTEAEIKEGDRIRVGESVIVVHIQEALNDAPRLVPAESDRYGTVPNAVFSLPGYRLLLELKQGGMGVVWKGEDTTNGRMVAIKTIRPDRAVSHNMQQLFLRETKMSLTMHHPNIVEFIDAGEQEGILFIIMEYIPGVDADTLRADRGGRLPYQDVVEIGLQSLNALDHAHQQGIVHRDMKPHNILVRGDACDDYDVKVADFGLAKKFIDHGFSTLTKPGDVRGTVPFMPPEQVLDSKNVDHLADIFGLAATLYNLLTDAYVYPFSKDEDALLTIITRDIVPLERRGVSVPPKLAEVIHRALNKNPRKRYQSAREMKAALQQVK